MQTYSKFSLLAVFSFSFLVLVYLIQNHEVVKVKNPKILGERDDARRRYPSERIGYRMNYIKKVGFQAGNRQAPARDGKTHKRIKCAIFPCDIIFLVTLALV